MKPHEATSRRKLSLIYELTIWLLYAGAYKYAWYLNLTETDQATGLFPHPAIVLYAIVSSLYWVLYYRLAVPRILQFKKYWLLFPVILLFVFVLSIPNNYLVSRIFMQTAGDGGLQQFYTAEFTVNARRMAYWKGWSFGILVPDLVAFSSIAFWQYAIESEYRNWQMERQNYQLKIDSLRATINPHFLFNTLNSVYGMTLLGKKEAPDFILQMSDAMRYILYESNAEKVLLEKEVAFIESYFAIENRRLGNVHIQFSAEGVDSTTMVAPLLLLPFIENSIKHGAHHFRESAHINTIIVLKDKQLYFEIVNDVHAHPTPLPHSGGVGIENVKARLALYYPGKHTLKMDEGNGVYKIYLSIDLTAS